MNETKQLNIRINLRSQQSKTDNEEAVAYMYRWDRIIVALLLITIAFSAVIASALSALNKQNQVTQAPMLLTPSHEKSTTASAITSTVTDTSVSTPNNTEMITTLPLANQIGVEAAFSSIETAQKETKNAVKENKEHIIKQENIITEAIFKQYKSEIFSENIKRFVIAKKIANKEPLGAIDEINFDTNNIATVYAYSVSSGLKDQILYYRWTLNGKTLAKVSVAVGANRWRSYSSKFIQPQMHGEWQVLLENKQGEILASNQFLF